MNLAMRSLLMFIFLLLVAHLCFSAPVLLDYIDTSIGGGGKRYFVSRPGGWWRDDAGVVRQTEEQLRRSDGGVWDVENTSAPHHIYAATDAAWWRVDPPAGEAAGFEIQFATVSLFRFIDAENWEEKTIDWARVPLTTQYDQNVIDYPLFSNVNLYVISTPNGYKSNFYVSNPGLIPSPTSAAYFGPAVDLQTVYFAVRYAVNKWPDSNMVVDGEPMEAGGIDAGYSAEFGDDLWMLPTHCYRNVSGFDGIGFTKTEDEAYVYYVFDRLSQEILVLAPYTLIQGADNVLIDPTTWTSGRTSGDYVNTIVQSTPTTNRGTDAIMSIGFSSSNDNRYLINFAGLPSTGDVSNVSATFILQYYNQTNTTTYAATLGRLLRDWSETTSTWNVYSTGNSWGTAGAANNGTDYNGTVGTLSTNAADLVISASADLNTICEYWLEGTYNKYGFVIWFPSGVGDNSRGFYTDDAATSTDRPYLAITYTAPPTLAALPNGDDAVNVIAGSVNAYIVVDVTTDEILAEYLVKDVSVNVLWKDGTNTLYGYGGEADEVWDSYSALDLIGGGTSYIFTSDYTVSQPGVASLYFRSDSTGYTETRTYPIVPVGGGESGLADRIDDATTLLAAQIDYAYNDLTATVKYQPGDQSITCWDTTQTYYCVVNIPTSLLLAGEGPALEITVSSLTANVSPDLEFTLKNNTNGSMVDINFRAADHVTNAVLNGLEFSRVTNYTDIADATQYLMRLRYPIPSAALTDTTTGTLRIQGSAYCPQYGTVPFTRTVSLYPHLLDAATVEPLTASLDNVDERMDALETDNDLIRGDILYQIRAVAEIDGATAGTAVLGPGHADVPAGYIAAQVVQTVNMTTGATETVRIDFYHWDLDESANIPVGRWRVEPGDWNETSGIVTSATWTDVVKFTGQDPDIVLEPVNEGGF